MEGFHPLRPSHHRPGLLVFHYDHLTSIFKINQKNTETDDDDKTMMEEDDGTSVSGGLTTDISIEGRPTYRATTVARGSPTVAETVGRRGKDEKTRSLALGGVWWRSGGRGYYTHCCRSDFAWP